MAGVRSDQKNPGSNRPSGLYKAGSRNRTGARARERAAREARERGILETQLEMKVRLEAQVEALKQENETLRTEMSSLLANSTAQQQMQSELERLQKELHWERTRRLRCEGDLEFWRSRCSHRSKRGSGGGWATRAPSEE